MIISLLKVVTAEDKTMHLNAEMELEEFRTKAGRFPIIEKEPVEFCDPACEEPSGTYFRENKGCDFDSV